MELLDYNEYSRPGTALEKVNGIVVHYTANPGTTAQQNRDYFEGLAQSGETHASSHFVIGISGEIIQCIPCNEIAYASNDRNSDTVSIECCIPDDTGKFTDATYGSLVHLVTWLKMCIRDSVTSVRFLSRHLKYRLFASQNRSCRFFISVASKSTCSDFKTSSSFFLLKNAISLYPFIPTIYRLK